MTISSLPLGYCTNVHPGRQLREVEQGIDQYTVPIRQQLGKPVAAGLWLSKTVVEELLPHNSRQRFIAFLADRQLPCYTLNAFPFGDFHSERVKENVYLPDWTSAERLNYTLNCARILADLLPDQEDGSISTVPLGFKELSQQPGFMDACCQNLLTLARELANLRESTGRCIRLAIEPEPLCVLETTPETLAFFDRLRSSATTPSDRAVVQEHLGVCYDICHQAVEFEDVAASIRDLHAAEIRLNKVHLSCAIEARHVAKDPTVRTALARYVEPRYLHQTTARDPQGNVLRHVDLSASFLTNLPADFAAADALRVHFHVPVDAVHLGPLGTTRPDLEVGLAAVAKLPYAPHLEVETYTWEVLPEGGASRLVQGMSRELAATHELLRAIS